MIFGFFSASQSAPVSIWFSVAAAFCYIGFLGLSAKVFPSRFVPNSSPSQEFQTSPHVFVSKT